jgi:hypothetical protein
VLGVLGGISLLVAAVYFATADDGGQPATAVPATFPTGTVTPTTADPSASSTTSTTTSATDTTPRATTTEADLTPWAELLAAVPDSAETRAAPITFYDYVRDRLVQSIDLPPAGADDTALAAYESAIGYTHPPFEPDAPTDLRDELGFDVGDLDQVVVVGTAPDELVIARGRFDTQAIDDAVHADPTWSSILETSDYNGTTVYAWGDDDAVTTTTSSVRPRGESRRYAVSGNAIIWGRSTAQVDASIDAAASVGPSLGASSSIKPLADLADARALVIAELYGSGTTYAAQAGAASGGPTVASPQSAIVGAAIETTATQLVAGLLYGSDAEAAANATPLQSALTAADAAWANVVAVSTESSVLVETYLNVTDPPSDTPPVSFPPALQ